MNLPIRKNAALTLLFVATLTVSRAQLWTPTTGILYADPTTTKVGVGTTTPLLPLNVAGPNAAPTGAAYTGGAVSIGSTATNLALHFGVNTTGSIYSWIQSRNQSAASTYYDLRLQMLGGKVGIGANSPIQTLDVSGRIHVLNGVIQTGGSAITTTSDLGLYSLNSGMYMRFVTNNAPIKFFTDGGTTPIGGTEKVTIAANGNMGINYANPTEKLQIDNGVFKLSSPNSYGGPMMLFAASPTAGYVGDWGIEYRPSSQGNPGLNFWKPFGGPNGGNNYLFLADNGNVGIRTDNPTANFTVNGNVVIGDPAVVCIPNANYKLFVQTGILTEKVKVAVNCSTDWADYVFDEKYNLKSINELEAFVRTNKHLPNVPSADEVVKNGIDMATMDAKLLEKIEELSLYIIELKKENTELAKRVEKIEKK
jgi:hypothetical protein